MEEADVDKPSLALRETESLLVNSSADHLGTFDCSRLSQERCDIRLFFGLDML